MDDDAPQEWTVDRTILYRTTVKARNEDEAVEQADQLTDGDWDKTIMETQVYPHGQIGW